MNTTTTTTHPIDEISGLIRDGVPAVFDTMLRLSAQPIPVGIFNPTAQEIVVGSVGFIGDANGMIYIHMTEELAKTCASQMLGFPASDLDEEMVNDVVGELSNMVVGAAKSLLCDAGSPCHLTIPSIIRGNKVSVEPVSPDERRILYFGCGGDCVLVMILMKQLKSEENKI
jgi:CheY-specific phosphatase CheX